KECDLDAWIKSLLVTESNPVAAEDSWNVRPVAGMIRRLWLDACGQSSSGVGVEAKQQSTPASLSLLPLSGSGQRLDAAERDKLRKMFEGNYPRTVINGATLPCLGFLSCVKAQCSARAWEWIPWKKGLSEGDSLAVKSRKGKSGDLLEIMSQAAGLGQDEWDLDLSNAPLRVTSILTVRAHAYCMCGVGHLSSWMQYVQKFVSHYTKPAGDGFRMPTAIEAEMADREVVGEVFRMVYDGVSMDRALLSVVKDDLLRIHLFCKPKPFKQRKGNQGRSNLAVGGVASAAFSCVPPVSLRDADAAGVDDCCCLDESVVDEVETGIVKPIVPSGVWDERAVDAAGDDCELRVFDAPWRSASEDVEFTKSLIMKDVEAGFAFILPGGEDEARARWGDHVAAGKLRVVRAPGRKPRLIGDGSVSGANGASCIPEKMRLPDLEGVQRFLSEADCAEAWWLFSFDVQGAHKLVRVREDEQGFSIFVLLEESVHGHELVWIGWRFNAVAGAAFLPYEKASKIVKGLRKLCDKGVEIDRQELEKVIGLLVWFCDGAFWLSPWLSCFYRILCKPRVVTRRILACQFLDVISSLTDEVRTSCKFSDCDVGKGWKLHSVNNVEIKGLSCRALQMPRVKRGCVSAVFFDYNAQKTKTSSDSAHAARLFCNAVESSVSIPLCIRYANDGVAAADAFADSDVARIGGWWLPQTGGSIAAGDAFWFSVVLPRSSWPRCLRVAGSESLQRCIAAFEAIAQPCLLLLRHDRGHSESGGFMLRFSQLCDNAGGVAVLKRRPTLRLG
ncbi:unnamed protein product, partial [Symbiodinium pilosum]